MLIVNGINFINKDFRIMHQSFVNTPHLLRCRLGDSQAMVHGNYFLIVHTAPGLVNLDSYPSE